MDMQKLVDAMNAAGESQRSNYHLTLGGLIKVLDAVAPSTPVVFENGGHPIKPHSYRGYYSDLAFDVDPGETDASSLLRIARGCVGKTFEGYKGGDFVMGEKTPLWVAMYGSCGDAIMSAEMVDGKLVLTSKDLEAA